MAHPEYETERLGALANFSRPLPREAFIQYVMAHPTRLGRISLAHLPNLQNVAGGIKFQRPFAKHSWAFCSQRKGCEFPTATSDPRQDFCRISHITQTAAAKFNSRPSRMRVRR